MQAIAAAGAIGLIVQGGDEMWAGILILAVVAFGVLRPDGWVMSRIFDWQKRSGRLAKETHDWSFSPEGIEFTTSMHGFERTCQPAWKDIKECVRTPDGFFLFFRMLSRFILRGFGHQWLPRRAFADPESLAAFAELVQTKVKNYRTAD
jgi:hypothetical protein